MCFSQAQVPRVRLLSDAVRTKFGIERVSNLYFWTDHRVRDIRKLESDRKVGAGPTPASQIFGTVGAVAVDTKGRIARGNLHRRLDRENARPHRRHAGDRGGHLRRRPACGVSCTGTGELFIRHAVAHDIVARMHYAKLSVADAARQSLDQLPTEADGVGGLIALDASGRHSFAMRAKLDGMYRGYVTEAGDVFVGIFATEKEKLMGRIDAGGKLVPAP